MMRLHLAAGAALAALCTASAAHAQTAAPIDTALPVGAVHASPFTGVTVFGDSLSDDGNIALASGLPNLTGTASFQKFTTNPGDVAVEALAVGLGLPLAPSLLGGQDLAFGGSGVTTNAPGTPAGVPNVTTQVTGYLAANPSLDANRLFTVWAGANDIFYHGAAALAGAGAAQAVAALPPGLPAAIQTALVARIDAAAAAQVGVAAVETSDQAGQAVLAAAGQEVALLTQLHAAGARYLVVFNLPDIGGTPQARATDLIAPGAAAAFTQLTDSYNTVLASGLSTLGTGIVPVNANLLTAETKANPALFGLVNVTTPACTTASSLTCTQNTLVAPGAAQTFLFADGVHPTTAAHAAIAQYILAELAAPAYASLLAEAPLAVSDSQRRHVADELAIDSTDAAAGVRLFASVDYDAQTFGAQSYSASLRNDGGLVTVGVDARIAPALSFGAALTYGNSYADFRDSSGKFHTQELLGSVFGQYRLGAAYFNGQAGFGGVDFRNVQRQFALGVGRRLERGSTSGTDINGSLTGGYWFALDGVHQGLKLGPFVSAKYDRVRVDGYGEQGGDSSSMTFGAQTREALIGEAGARAQATVRLPFVTLSPFVQAAYAYDGDAERRRVTGGLVSLPGTFDAPGFRPDKQWATVEAGADARLNDKISLFAAYNGRFSDDSQRYTSVNVGAKYVF